MGQWGVPVDRMGVMKERSKEPTTSRPRRDVIAPIIAAALALVAAIAISKSYGVVVRRWEALRTIEDVEGRMYGLRKTLESRIEGASPGNERREETERWSEDEDGEEEAEEKGDLGTQIRAAERSLRAVPALPEIDRVLAALRRYRGLADEALALTQSGDHRAANALVRSRGRQAFSTLTDAIEEAQPALGRAAIQAERRAGVTAAAALVGAAVLLTIVLMRLERVRRQSALRAAQETAAREEQRKFKSLVQRASDMITVSDVDGTILYDSPAVERILGWNPAERVGIDTHAFLHPDDVPTLLDALRDLCSKESEASTIELRYRHADGRWRWVESTWTNMLDEPTIGGLVANYRVIDERKAFEQRLTKQAHHDALTGLGNRAHFHERVARRMMRRSGPELVALLFIDLDDFKTVNDGLGHQAGDDLLRAVARRLEECIRQDDVLVRLGGDEFAILASPEIASVEQAADLAQRIVRSLEMPFSINGKVIYMRASVGIATSDQTADGVEGLLRNADIAMYMAKAAGKARYEIFHEGMRSQLSERVDLTSELRTAISTGQLLLHYQPIVDLDTSAIMALEALVRWDHPTRGLLPPGQFIDIAESSGAIVPLGEWVLREACRRLAVWRERYPQHSRLRMAVNLSSAQLRHPSLVRTVTSAIRSAGILPRDLIVEVTESVLNRDIDAVAHRLSELRRLGVAIAIDDFGTGYSSMAHLKEFPVDQLKIDRSFVEGIAGGPEESALGRAIVKLAHALQLEVIAEGIERSEQEAELRRSGCHAGQGYLFARPADADSIDAFLSAQAVGTDLISAAMSSESPTVERRPIGSASGTAAHSPGEDHLERGAAHG